MFENFSRRALQIVFTARANGGKRGAEALDVGDLVIGILLEDQNKLASVLSETLGVPGEEASMVGFEPHTSFFSAESASDLLVGVEAILSHSTPIPNSEDMSVSDDLSRVFELTEKLRSDLHHAQVQPLHFLVVILEDSSKSFATLLGRAGITKEAVLAALNGNPQ